MGPTTLAAAVERSQRGALWDAALAELVDAFDLAPTPKGALFDDCGGAGINERQKLDALVEAIAQDLAKQHKLGRVPPWASGPAQFLDHRWHTCPFENDAMREYLTSASPAEFAPRDIFTEQWPLRRARSPFGRHIPDAT